MKTRYTLLDKLRVPTYDDSRQMVFGDVEVDKDKCRECGFCVLICPGASLITDFATKMDIMNGTVKKGKYGIPRLSLTKTGAPLCLACGDCTAACPHGAIRLTNHFNPGYRFKRLTQAPELTFPKRY